MISGVERQTLGAPSKPATFITLGFLGLLQAGGPPIAASSATLLIALNLAVFAAARYSATAWDWPRTKPGANPCCCRRNFC